MPLLLLSGSYAQENISCSQLLRDARDAFDGGMIELVPGLIRSCLEEAAFDDDERIEAYRLLITSYLFDYLPDEADSLMADFVQENREYVAREDDAGEFVQLYNTHLAALEAREQAADELAAREDSIRAGIRAQPDSSICRRKLFLGFNLGATASSPLKLEAYSLGDLSTSSGAFGPLPGIKGEFLLGISAGAYLELGTGIHAHYSRFAYTDAPLSYSDYHYQESSLLLGLPLNLLMKLNPRSAKACWYIRLGARGEYLLSAHGEGERSTGTGGPDLLVGPEELTGAREGFGISLQSGVGVRMPLGKAFFQAEAGYDPGLLMANLPEMRYANENLIWGLYYIDSDFIRQYVHLDLGVFWYLK